MNHSLVLIKPDAFERNLVGHIIGILEHEFKIIQARIEYMNTNLISRHYKDHVGEPYYNALHEFMRSGPTLALALFNDDCVVNALAYRDVIRKQLGVENPRNLIHSSDPQNVLYELDLWFPEHAHTING